MHLAQPVVTVVTPSYNQGRFIRATIESVLSQDYPHVEYIVMDGGSTDDTASVVKDYASRLTFVSENDRGQSHAINKGFQRGKGTLLSWLNSDDLYLPGAIRAAVEGFKRNPLAGAVYGEGYLIDGDGAITRRFPWTEPINLWKLMHLSDYILQQTVFFRRDVLDDVGYLDEDLNFTMDWDVLIRIGCKYPLEYIPLFMGCLREHGEAKTSAGGVERVRELGRLLRHHTGLRLPPGHIVYGLDTYQKICCEWTERLFPSSLKPVSNLVQSLVGLMAGSVIAHTIQHSQGLHADGWASRRLYYALPPGKGSLVIQGDMPDWPSLRAQKLSIVANGRHLGKFAVPNGDFELKVEVPQQLERQMLRLRIDAHRAIQNWISNTDGGRRRLAYRLKSIGWSGQDAADRVSRDLEPVSAQA